MMKYSKLVYLSLFVTFGITLHIVESSIPVPVPIPGAKLGLANIMALIAILIFGTKEGLIVNVLRCIIGSTLYGSMSSLIYSLSGAVVATLIMGIFYSYCNSVFSPIGISVLGGIFHNVTQLTVAMIILKTGGLYVYLPHLLLTGLVTGIFTGILAFFVEKNLRGILKKMKYF
ncbi:Gx transporter family protein [Thermovenabulum gondwanense]|uniref:Heptaprenyl diphosphate synthase component I n=1 Tax=Thermovenabulum gondwanense TaxID=520767 RepID=A0A162MAB7_9FIRM|nr:Gx transporter family protein [Thermovenabulum gondwanense]KYO64781.1 hypothetical protein ATZ99_18390 [Thermovenabulum gondwanense]